MRGGMVLPRYCTTKKLEMIFKIAHTLHRQSHVERRWGRRERERTRGGEENERGSGDLQVT